jgi:outer membrane protein assembly factor BamB
MRLLLSCTLLLTASVFGKDGVTFFRTPKPLSAEAKTTDWPRFLGPLDKPISPESPLQQDIADGKLKLVWECQTGEGYACPAIVGDSAILFYAADGKENIQRHHAETGKLIWRASYPLSYRDRLGYANGPRAGAVVADGQIFTFGVASQLSAHDLATGKQQWSIDTAEAHGVPQYFFGSGASPLVHDAHVILNLGGADEQCVVAFDRKTGKVAWTTKHPWGQSYASPILATLQGRESLLVFAGGESKPSTGGLLCIDPKDGKLDDAFAWRARRYASVNASSPVLAGPNQVLITQSYVDTESPCNGAVLLELTPERKWKEVWKNPELGCHWMTPVYHEGHFYAFSHEKEHACEIMCVSAKDGKIVWRNRPEWNETLNGREIPLGFNRASLLQVDGKFLCLGEMGTLAWLGLSPDPVKGCQILSKTQLFLAPQTWVLPAVSRGLLYVVQSEADLKTKDPARVLCYDLRR